VSLTTSTEGGSGTSAERRYRRNSWTFNLWAIAFAASFLGGNWLLKATGWEPQGIDGVAFSLFPVVPGFFTARAFLRLFHGADEMMRAILTEGLLFGFGAVIIFWGAIQLPEHIWLDKVSADTVISLMLGGFLVGAIRAQWRRQ